MRNAVTAERFEVIDTTRHFDDSAECTVIADCAAEGIAYELRLRWHDESAEVELLEVLSCITETATLPVTAYGRVSVSRWVESSEELPTLLCDRWAQHMGEARDCAYRCGQWVFA
jgi:hypothetical protein